MVTGNRHTPLRARVDFRITQVRAVDGIWKASDLMTVAKSPRLDNYAAALADLRAASQQLREARLALGDAQRSGVDVWVQAATEDFHLAAQRQHAAAAELAARPTLPGLWPPGQWPCARCGSLVD
jgi:hypothetical protein